MGKKKKKPPDFKPDLEKLLPEEKRKYVTYEAGAQVYEVGKWTIAEWAKNAGATLQWKRRIVVDLDFLDEYLQREKIKPPKRRKRDVKA